MSTKGIISAKSEKLKSSEKENLKNNLMKKKHEVLENAFNDDELFVEFLLDERGDVLLDVVALERLGGDVNGILLHVLGHVSVLHDGLSVCHLVILEKNVTRFTSRVFSIYQY